MPLDGKENAPAGVNGVGTKGAVHGRADDYAARVAQVEPLFLAGFKFIELRGKRPIRDSWQEADSAVLNLAGALSSLMTNGKHLHNVGAVAIALRLRRLPCSW